MDATFSAEEEELLIELVRTCPALYNAQDASYKDSGAKCNAWKKIAEQIDKKEDVCKTKWKHIRDWYSRKKKEGKLPTRSGVLGTHLRSRYERLAFLDVYGESRMINISETKESFAEAAAIQNDGQTANSNAIVYENGESMPSLKDEENTIIPNEDQPTITKLRTLRKRSRVFRPRLLLNRGKSCTENLKLIREIIQRTSASTTQHPVDDFFKAMASVVKQLPAELQVQIKQDISNIVLSAEAQVVSARSIFDN